MGDGKREGQPDRITISASRRISISKYDGFEPFMSYSRDREPGETPEQAIRKTEKLVLDEFNRLVELCEKGKIEGARREQ